MATDDGGVNVTADLSEFASYEDHALLQSWDFFVSAIQQRQTSLQAIESEIKRRLDDREGSMIDDPDYICRMETTMGYDKSLLWPLKELVDPDTLKENGWTPPHEEEVPAHTRQVPEAWNMTKIKPLAKLGKKIAAIIEAAQIPGARRMVIKRKEKPRANQTT